MRLIVGPDAMHLQAAHGWFELGNAAEAYSELKQIDELFRFHPEVLQLRWHIQAKEKNWKACREVGRIMTKLSPESVQGWINLANSLFYLRQFQEAYDTLFPILETFSNNPYIPYNLACYQCQLGNLKAAGEWLEKAIEIGGERIRETALLDPDLDPLKDEISRAAKP